MGTNTRNQSGLDRRKAEKALEEFLDSGHENKVFAIKGDWGVGKTHLVLNFLKDRKCAYHYGSCFGLPSIDEVKMQLFTNFKSKRYGGSKQDKNPNPTGLEMKVASEDFQDVGNVVGNLVKLLPGAEKIGAGFAPALLNLGTKLIIENTLKDKLICIDDIERRRKTVSLDELFGFVEQLAENKGCQIVLIYNEKELCFDEEDEAKLKNYREKVIDYEVKLEPSIVENFHIGFGENHPYEEVVLDYLARNSIQLNNIRLFKKLRWNIDKIESHINEFLFEVKCRIIEEVIFMVLARLHNDFPVDMEKLLSSGGYEKAVSTGTQEEKDRSLRANRLGYTGSVISEELNSLTETSICNYERLCEAGKIRNDRELKSKVTEELHEKVYKLYRESFAPSEEIIRERLISFLESHCTSLYLTELNYLDHISATIGLNIASYKSQWLKHVLEKCETLEEVIQVKEAAQTFDDLTVELVASSLEKRVDAFKSEMSITSVLTKTLDDGGWSKSDTGYLNGVTLEHCEDWLLEEHPRKDSMIKQGLRMKNKFSETLKEAIRKLAKKSQLNEMRAKDLYDIKIDNDSAIET